MRKDIGGEQGKFTVKAPSGSVNKVDFGTSSDMPSCAKTGRGGTGRASTSCSVSISF